VAVKGWPSSLIFDPTASLSLTVRVVPAGTATGLANKRSMSPGDFVSAGLAADSVAPELLLAAGVPSAGLLLLHAPNISARDSVKKRVTKRLCMKHLLLASEMHF
jgi:hypothetical protein